MEVNQAPIKVLLVEDNPGDARLIMEYLAPSEGERFDVTIVERLEFGVEKLRQNSYDVVLLDLTLPDSDGLATFVKMNCQSQTMPVIVLTGLDDKSVGVEAVKAGAQDYLLKNEANHSVLVRTIRHSIERASLESEILRSNQTLEDRVNLRTKELEAEKERVARSEKLALIGQLSGGVAHDLRNPLGAIRNAAYYIKKRYQYDKDHQFDDLTQWIDLIEREVATANDVITNLLSNGITKEPVFTEIQIFNIIHNALDSIALRKNILLSIIADPELPSVVGDSAQLIRVFQNLIANAQDAIEHHGRLTIDAERQGRSVKIVISDTGIGISPENLEKVFDPLYTAKTNGTGLGLSVCQDIIGKHNGSISVESKMGTGTSFTLLLPMAR